MNTIKTTSIAVSAALGLLLASPASAAPLGSLLNSDGSTSVYLDVLDMGTTGYTTSVNCNSVASCNTASGTSVGDAFTSGEDTWGIFKVSKITNVDVPLTWQSGIDAGFLRGMFYGLKDSSVTYSPSSYTAKSSGGQLDIYYFATDALAGAGDQTPGTRSGPSSFTNFTNGTLWMSLTFDNFQSVFTNVPSTTSVSATVTGNMSVIGSNYADAVFDTDDHINPALGLSDFYFSGTPSCSYSTRTGNSCKNWTTAGQMTANGYLIPEPGSMALAGLGLMGIAALRRRKAQA